MEGLLVTTAQRTAVITNVKSCTSTRVQSYASGRKPGAVSATLGVVCRCPAEPHGPCDGNLVQYSPTLAQVALLSLGLCALPSKEHCLLGLLGLLPALSFLISLQPTHTPESIRGLCSQHAALQVHVSRQLVPTRLSGGTNHTSSPEPL